MLMFSSRCSFAHAELMHHRADQALIPHNSKHIFPVSKVCLLRLRVQPHAPESLSMSMVQRQDRQVWHFSCSLHGVSTGIAALKLTSRFAAFSLSRCGYLVEGTFHAIKVFTACGGGGGVLLALIFVFQKGLRGLLDNLHLRSFLLGDLPACRIASMDKLALPPCLLCLLLLLLLLLARIWSPSSTWCTAKLRQSTCTSRTLPLGACLRCCRRIGGV
mmetsp:Transcript_80218/g.141594  ORF Transcript_80218/g.141594 Transcript_80218/m.141594 type:complete len:217 (+) Transcript_80218:135-785(+)